MAWVWTPGIGGVQGGGDITETENSYFGFWLRIITVYYGNYGTFLKDFIDSEPRPQKAPETLMFEKTLENRADLLRILRNITVRNVSPPPVEYSSLVLPLRGQTHQHRCSLRRIPVLRHLVSLVDIFNIYATPCRHCRLWWAGWSAFWRQGGRNAVGDEQPAFGLQEFGERQTKRLGCPDTEWEEQQEQPEAWGDINNWQHCTIFVP